MPAVRALLAAGPNHLGVAQPLPVATSDTLPPLLHTQVGRLSFPEQTYVGERFEAAGVS